MRKFLRSASLALALFLLLSGMYMPCVAQAATTYKVKYSVTYQQSEARKTLALVNTFRTGNEAWYWNANNTAKVNVRGLKALKYDYGLEKIAMQRCAEIALRFDHVRTNGKSYYTAYTFMSYYSGENLSYSYPTGTASAFVNNLKENTCLYNGQGHRRNMLSKNYAYYGAAMCKYNGGIYFVQEFSQNGSGTAATKENNSTQTVTAQVLSSYITQSKITSVSVKKRKTVKLSKLYLKIKGNVSMNKTCPVYISGAKVTSTNTKYAKVQNSYYLKGIKKGKVKFKVKGFGKTATAYVTIK